MKLSLWWQNPGVSKSKCVSSMACLQASELIFSGNNIRGLFLKMYVILFWYSETSELSVDAVTAGNEWETAGEADKIEQL